MADTNNVVILRVSLDEGKTEEQLAKLVLDIEATKRAQSDLNIMRKNGLVADEAYAKQTVALRAELKSQQVEQTALTKNLDLYRKATGELGNTYQGVQAQLSLAQNQFKLLDGSQDNSTESARALTGVIEELRTGLTQTDETQKLFIRNVGNYPKGENIASLVQQLVKLEEETKRGTQTTEEANRAQMQIAGFRTQAMQAAAKEGLSYEQTEARLKDYSAAIRPAVTALVALEKEQEAVTKSGGGTEEQVRRIGFQMAKLEKAIEDVPPVAQKAGGTISGAFGQVSEAAQTLGIDTGALEGGFARAKKGVDIAKTAFGTLRGAMLALPIFLIIAGLAALVSYFTKSREGAAALETAMAKAGAVMDVIIDRASRLGKAITQVFSGEFTAAAETARQSFAGVGDEMQREITLAAELSKARQQLERDEINNIDTNKRLLNQVERLKNVRDNEFNSIGQRKAANEAAYKFELEREKTLADLAERRVALLLAEINRRGGLAKASNADLKAYKEAQNELADIQEDAAGKQNEFITNRFQLTKEGLDKQKEAAAAAEAIRKKRDDDMLKSIEADIAAGKSREEAAAAYLASEDKARAVAAARETQRKADAKAETTAAYQADLAMLERNLDARRVAVETDYATGRTSKAQYEARLTIVEEGGYAGRLLLAQHHKQDLTELQKAQTRAHNAELLKQTEKERTEFERRAAVATDFGQQIGSLFAQTLTDTGLSLQDFAAKALILILDSLEKQVLAQQAAATAASLAQPDSVATFGATGLVRAAVINALIIAAFEGAKGLITSGSSSQFAAGGVLDGPSHAGGGVQLYSRGGHHYGEAEGNEVILTKGVWNNPLLRPMASMLNQMGGGAALMPRAHLALGGVVGVQPAGLLRGEVGPGLDYKRLAEALRQVPLSVSVRDTKAAAKRDAFTQSLANS